MRIPKTLKPLLAALLLALSAPALAGEIAVVDVARVIDASLPGKAGQKYIDGVKASLDAELAKYRASLGPAAEGDARLAQKEALLAARYQKELSRVTSLLVGELRKAASDWLKGNKDGVTLVLPASQTLAAAPETDVNAELLRRLNAAVVDFTKK